MPINRPTYRYGVTIVGANYAGYGRETPSHFIMAETLKDVKRIIKNFAYGVTWRYEENGAGHHSLPETPNYGEPGDYADVFIVDRNPETFSEVLDEPGDRARHAWFHMHKEPSYRFIFGPRGGLPRHNF